MNKKVCVFCILIGLCCSAFAQKKLNVGNYENSRTGFSISCFDNFSIRLSDKEKIEIILYFMNVDSTVKAANAIREIITSDKNKIGSVYDILKFFDKNKIKYEYKKYNDSSNYFIGSQAFVEEYLVSKYRISSGCKRIYDNYTVEWNNWNQETKNYDHKLITSDLQTTEYRNWNEDHYEYKLDILSECWANEYKNWNKDTKNYDYKLITWLDSVFENHTTEYRNWNKDTGQYEHRIDTYTDHTEEYKNWNKDSEYYNYKLEIYSDYSLESRNWNSEYSSYDYQIYIYKDYTSEWQRTDGTYYNVDVKDEKGKLIAYAHIISPLKNGMRDIEVLSENTIYRYIGVKEADGKFSFMSCIKIENGKETKLGGGTLSRNDFYRNDKYLLNKVGN